MHATNLYLCVTSHRYIRGVAEILWILVSISRCDSSLRCLNGHIHKERVEDVKDTILETRRARCAIINNY